MKKTLKVIGMSCEHCERAVKEEVGKVQGVSSVLVNLGSKQVEVEGSNLNDFDLRKAVEEAGYVVESIS